MTIHLVNYPTMDGDLRFACEPETQRAVDWDQPRLLPSGVFDTDDVPARQYTFEVSMATCQACHKAREKG